MNYDIIFAFGFIVMAIFATLIGGIVGAILALSGVVGMIIMIERKPNKPLEIK